MIGLGSILSQFLLVRWRIKKQKEDEKEKQKDIITSLSTLTKVIKEDIKGHKKIIKNHIIPSYFISSIPSNFYITSIKSHLNGNETRKLKECLIKAQHKIENINRLISLAQEAHTLSDKGTWMVLLMEIKDNDFKYHKHLSQLINQINSELEKLM